MRIGDDRGVAARHLREIVPVAAVAIRRDIAVGQIEIEVPIVVQIAELRAETPAAEFDAHGARQIFILEVLSRRPGFRHPEVVPLQEDAGFGDVRDIDGKLALIENVTDRRVHPTLGRKTNARLFADFAETYAAVVEIQLRDAVIVGNEQVWIAAPAQISRGRGQGPAAALDAQLLGHIFKAAVTAVAQQVLPSTVLRVLEAFRHDPGGRQLPQVDVLRIIAADEQIQPPIAIIIQPDSRVGIDPARQPGVLR